MTELEYDITADPLALCLACKLCVLDRWNAGAPLDLDGLPRYSSADALRIHWNESHAPAWFQWKGTERAWVGIIKEARGVSAGFMVSCGDGECTHFIFWCLRCNHQTTDPVAVILLWCPVCQKNYNFVNSDRRPEAS